MIWLISANPKVYDHSRSFSDHGFVDWRQGSTKYSKGDIVYIYVTKPEQSIKYQCIVEKTNLTGDKIRNDKEYWVHRDDFENSLSGYFTRLKLINKTNNKLLGLDHLRKNGLSNAPQGPKRILDEKLLDYIQKNFNSYLADHLHEEHSAVTKSLSMDTDLRKSRIRKAPKKPKKIAVITYIYERSPDIVAEALIRANGHCERCKSPAPFKRKKDKTPYLEVHHKIRLSDGGEDTMKNVIALCPNCHRRAHYGLQTTDN